MAVDGYGSTPSTAHPNTTCERLEVALRQDGRRVGLGNAPPVSHQVVRLLERLGVAEAQRVAELVQRHPVHPLGVVVGDADVDQIRHVGADQDVVALVVARTGRNRPTTMPPAWGT